MNFRQDKLPLSEDEKVIRRVAYEIAVKYQAEVRKLQELDDEFVRRFWFNPREFIFTS